MKTNNSLHSTKKEKKDEFYKEKKRLKVYCPYSVLDLEWEILKNFQNITFEKPWYLRRNNNESIH